MRLQAVLPHALHDAKPLAELREAADQVIERPGRDQFVAAAEGGDQALSDVTLFPE